MKSLPKYDTFQYISLQIKALKLCGAWFYIPHPVGSLKFWLHVLLKIFLGISIMSVPLLGQSIYLIQKILSNAEIHEITGIINLILTELLISLELLDLLFRRNSLRDLTRLMKKKEFFHGHGPQKDIIRKSVELSNKLWLWICVFAAVDLAGHLFVAPAMLNFKVLPVRMDFIFFDVLERPYYFFIFLYQTIYKPILSVPFVSLQTMRWAFMLCTISQLDVLIYNFENMEEIKSSTNTNLKRVESFLKRNIVHHRAIIQFVAQIEDTFGGQFILFFIINSGIICTTATHFTMVQNPLNHTMELFWMFGFFSLMVIILFIDCYFASTITQKNSHISTVVYCYPWVNLPQRMQKNFIIFIGRNQRTMVIRAAKVIPVSMTTFTKVINWTYKGFAVLNQMKK